MPSGSSMGLSLPLDALEDLAISEKCLHSALRS